MMGSGGSARQSSPQRNATHTRCGKPRAQPQLIGADLPGAVHVRTPHQCDFCHVIAAALLPFFHSSFASATAQHPITPQWQCSTRIWPRGRPHSSCTLPLSPLLAFPNKPPHHPVARITGNPHLIFACRYAQQPTAGPAIQAGEFRFRTGIIYLFLLSSVPDPPNARAGCDPACSSWLPYSGSEHDHQVRPPEQVSHTYSHISYPVFSLNVTPTRPHLHFSSRALFSSVHVAHKVVVCSACNSRRRQKINWGQVLTGCEQRNRSAPTLHLVTLRACTRLLPRLSCKIEPVIDTV
jgi:hypothetical protein